MQYQPGQSGNPTGKPPGTRNRTTLLFEKAMHADARAAVRAICRRAAKGDPVMAELFCLHILPRLAPLRRGAPVAFDLGEIDMTDSGVLLTAIVRAAATGALTVEEAERLGNVVRAKIESADVAELLTVVRKLEAPHVWKNSSGNGSGVAADPEADRADRPA